MFQRDSSQNLILEKNADVQGGRGVSSADVCRQRGRGLQRPKICTSFVLCGRLLTI